MSQKDTKREIRLACGNIAALIGIFRNRTIEWKWSASGALPSHHGIIAAPGVRTGNKACCRSLFLELVLHPAYGLDESCSRRALRSVERAARH
jgi:hypothetical protein